MELILIVGEGKDVGKTLLGERLVAALVGKGFHVGVVKHVHHGVDYRVKDTGRYLGAGAKKVVAIGPREYMVVEKERIGFWEAIMMLRGFDVVVVEGFREHIDNIVRHGGCTAYVGGSGVVEIEQGSRSTRSLDEALERLLDLIFTKRCTIAFS
ncbi:MAG: molybdopterin-guanine dinucleotide biosynthesis protein MobB [Caldisphaeraceae archaeon]|nr:molybdopterin-guanine dinucleotide biosynthesis protein MobB [Caldisphaeraceae archaeon]